ncbi:MAG: phosphate regulon transcriptional regulator PhoB [Gammaproteobacteria bacterium]|nr:phosphate regulon transcriptional regulator PhoB [Gammaproteobacteria bacterium]
MPIEILLLEDEAAIREMTSFALSRAGYKVTEAADVDEAQAHLSERLPDLVLVDWMLPEISGIEFIRRLKRDDVTRDLPVIMLTARTEEDDKVRGLETGVDDYVTKPFSTRELIARIRALLRRTAGGDSDTELRVQDLRLNAESHAVFVGDSAIQLGPTEYRLLKFLMSNTDRVYSRTQLLDFVWGRNTYIEERTVDVHVLRLRKALAPYGFDRFVQTVRGAGYRFAAKSSKSSADVTSARLPSL